MSKTEPIHDKIHVHKLDGCRPTPLAHYLKALGIFRLVAEQADPKARGWWKDDVFHLATTLDKDALERFFLDEYSPTPMTAPWLARSGYSKGSSHSKTRKHLSKILKSTATRFDLFRNSFVAMENLANETGVDLDDPNSCRNEKFIIAATAAACPSVRDWIRSMVVAADNSINYPAVFGTGGNEGSGSYLANYYVALDICLVEKVASVQFALWLTTSKPADDMTKLLKQGSFIAGHFETSQGLPDPWNFLLSLEGIAVLKTSLSRRASENLAGYVSGTGASMAAPFSTGNSCCSYPSNAAIDSKTVSQGNAGPGRGEQWFPLWQSPSGLSELRKLFQEGRSHLRPKHDRRSVDFARALSKTGVSRGLSSFQRVGYFQRNGKNHMAIPLGAYSVGLRTNQHLLDEVAPWIDHFRRVANAKNAPVSFLRAHKACEEAMMVCTQKPNGRSFLDLLTTLGRAEDQMLASPKHAKENNAKPIPSLTQRWADIILNDASSTELRLAFSLAAQSGPLKSKERWKTVRHHWLPLDGKYFAATEGGLAIGPVQCAHGLDLERAAIALVNRRLLAMASGAAKGFIPLAIQNWRFGADSKDIEAFLQYQVDDAKILSYARGLMAIDLSLKNRPGSGANTIFDKRSAENKQPLGGLAAYGLLRLAHPTKAEGVSIGNNHDAVVRCNPTIFRRLQSGDLPKAVELAARQLSHAGIRPRFNFAIGTQHSARRLAASLAFGISPPLMTRLAYGLTAPEISVAERNSILNATADS